MARPSLSNSTPLYHNGVRVSGPADLDPLEAAAAPITTDPHVRQHLHDDAAGDDMVGRFRFVHGPTGMRAVDTSPTPAQTHSEFMRWVNESPGSSLQAQYDPASFAEYQRMLSESRHQDYLKEVATYGSSEGPDWRSRLTPEQVAARQERAAREKAASEERLAHREALKTDPRYADLRERQAQRKADLDRRMNNVRLLRQNPFLTLNDPAASDLQKQVLVDAYFRNPQNDADPRVQVARMEADVRRQAIAADERMREQEMKAKARADRLARGDARDRHGVDNATAVRGQDVAARTAAGNNTASLMQSVGNLGMQWLLNQATNATNRAIAEARQPKPPPGQEELMQLQADDLKNKNAQAATAFAEQYISKNYAWDRGLKNYLFPWGGSEFTAEEQRGAYDALKAQYPQLPDQQIRQIVASIAARKTSDPAAF